MAKDSKGSGQGEIQAKVNALTSGLQSLKIVINDLRQQGFQGGLIFEALSEKIGKLLTAEGALTKELEEQKIKFKNNREQLALYTKEQQKVQAAIDGTVKVIGSLTKEQIDNTKRTTKLEAEKAKGAFESGKVAEKAQLDVLEKIKLRLAQEGRIIQAIQELEQKQLESNDRVKKSAEANQKAKFKSQKAALKAEETAKEAALRANDALELQKIKSSKLSVSKRKKAELDLLNKIQKRYKKGSADYTAIEKQKVKATSDSLKKRDALVKKYQESRPAPAPTAKSAGASFLGGLKSGFNVGDLGKGIGRITGIGSALQAFQKILGTVREALVGSFKAAVNFEAQLAQLQAVTGVNNDELARLEKNVLNVAGSTKFTSEQIVELQTELGKLGFSVDEIEKSTLAVSETAQALGESVGPVAQKIGQILNQYNLTATETVLVSDTLVSVINSSALSFESFGTALQYIGPLGAEVGTTFGETANAMAVLADNGFTASRIGTGLRGILTELSSTGKDLNTVLGELAEEEISLAEAVDLVGKRNAAQLITLIDNIEALQDAEGKYYNVGAAAIASAQQIDTYAGNLDLLKSAFNRVQIEFGNFLKFSGLLKLSLKLLDEQGYETALAMDFLADVDPEDFADGLGKAAENAVALTAAASEFADPQKIYGDEAVKLFRDSLKPLQLEYIENEERLNVLRNLGAGERTSALQKEQKALNERQKDIKEYKISQENILATQKEITRQIEAQAKQIRLSNARNAIEEKYAAALKDVQERRSDDNLDLEKALVLRKELEDKEAALKIVKDEQLAQNDKLKQDLKDLNDISAPQIQIDILKKEIELGEVKLEQYEQESSNLINAGVSREKLFELAQKEYQVEFSELQNLITAREQKLKQEEDYFNLQIKTRQNEIDILATRIEGTENDEERKRLQEQQTDLLNKQVKSEQDRAALQKSANSDIQGYLDDVEEKLTAQDKLWSAAGFDTTQLRILEKARQRLKQITLSMSKLKLDAPEALTAADNLANSLKARFADSLKDGGMLSSEDEKEINKLIADTFAGFDLTDDQKQIISDYIYSGLKPGKKTEEDLKKNINKLLEDIFGEVTEVIKAYNETALENTTNRLKSELDEVKNRYETEGDIIKSQLDNQLITESQFRAKQKELRQKQLAEENSINKQIFESQKKSDLNVVAAETAESLFSNILNNFEKYDFTTAGILSILSTAAVGAAGAAKANAIQRRKFYPVRYEEGGMVNGPSHSEGGVPFTVRGQGGYEMEGGEFIVNRKAASMNRSLLEKINNSYKVPSSPSAYKFAMGGSVQATADESVNYLKAIAEATTSTAISSSKPVRAYVSSADLRTNETERRLRDKNDRI